MSLTSYQLYDYDEGFNLIDWEIMTKVGLTDDHAKRIKMAECLSDRVIPVRAFKCFYVSSESVKIYVESVLLEQPRPTGRTRIPLQPSGFLTLGCIGTAI